MQLIKKIEINYLRSIYSASIDDVGDINVIFGRNDSGKSNVLRALNLFFNDKIEPGCALDFDLDMSDRRKQEARVAKGRQFIWIKVAFNIPSNYQSSLGAELSIKRQWNRDGDLTQNTFPEITGAGKLARLTRFLNEIDFTYIPAIKDLNVYADLIERMYGAAAETAALRDATSRFVDAIDDQTSSLSNQLAALFGTPAKLAPPTEMSRLFRNLDFAHGEDGHSLLRQKGDGIKARHLPELLRFINGAESKKKFYLWGFEEPENSLDLGAAEMEAFRFADFAARADTQVFITSHSPAFYLSDGNGAAKVRRIFITKQCRGANDEMEPRSAAAIIDRIDDAEIRMEKAGLLQLPFIIRQMDEQRRALKDKEGEAKSLRAEIEKIHQPTLFVEGMHDVALFTSALARVGGNSILVKALGGTPQSADALLSAVLKQGGMSTTAQTLFLFDNDRAGRGAFRKLISALPKSEPTKYDTNIYAWALPWTEGFKKFAKRHSIQEDQAFFTAEFLYPEEEAANICLQLVEGYDPSSTDDYKININGDYWNCLGQSRCHKLMTAKEGEVDWFYARGVPDCLKGRFAIEAEKRSLSTSVIDGVAKVISNYLLQS